MFLDKTRPDGSQMCRFFSSNPFFNVRLRFRQTVARLKNSDLGAASAIVVPTATTIALPGLPRRPGGAAATENDERIIPPFCYSHPVSNQVQSF